VRPQFELSQIIDRFGREYIEQYLSNSFTLRTLDALQKCRTSALGGHKDVCDCCNKERISYNSCGNRHCPKCQSNKQAIWADERMSDAMEVKYFHVVFTVPEALNQICLLDSRRFTAPCLNASGAYCRLLATAIMGLKPGLFVCCIPGAKT
jgi:hypothetical protein